MRTTAPFLLAAFLLISACSEPIEPNPPAPGSSIRGGLAFNAACASCHSSGDGFDLAFFSFADSTIIRRALKHVDLTTANFIVDWIHSIPAPQHARDERPFQPAQTLLPSDIEFARALFGSDAWPATLTTAQLRALDPLQVPVAIALPRWSVEEANTDWMPDVPLPASILADQDSAPARAIGAYRQVPTLDNLLRAMTALFSAMQRNDSPGPCHFESRGRVDVTECFNAERWAGSLVAQHMFRAGITTALPDTSFHNMWWETGDAARRAESRGVTLPNANQLRISWMYLGWMFGAANHPTFYMIPGLQTVGLTRHAVWVAMRSMVARPAGGWLEYDDLLNSVRYGYDGWLYASQRFGYRHLLERIQAGDLPPSARIADARARVSSAAAEAGARLPAAQRDSLNLLAKAVLDALPLK